ncbi:MAG: hypothetical protein K1Y36_25615 [Blastocatellia bacterium]|nr:hypothetical protein [Blastocatellia bacterium]
MKSLVRFAVIISFFCILLVSFQRVGNSALQGLTLTVTEPADRSYTNQTKVTIAGNVNTEGATVTANSTDLAVASDNTFRGQISLPSEGPNSIEVRAIVGAKSMVSVTRTVFRDTIAPTLLVSQPAEGTTVAAPQVEVRGSAADASPFSITVNGISARIVGGKDALWFVTVPLISGLNNLQVQAVDLAGNRIEIVRRVYRPDSQLPLLQLDEPSDNTLTNDAEVRVSGQVRGDFARIQLNGTTLNIQSDGSFRGFGVLNKEGANQIAVTAFNGQGTSTTITRTIVRDTTPPQLSGVQPADLTIVDAPQVEVHGSYRKEMPDVLITVNGFVAVTSGGGGMGVWSAQVPISPGENTIFIKAQDAVGNVTQQSLTLYRPGIPLSLQVGNPSENTIINTPRIQVSGYVTGTKPVVRANGEPLTIAENGYFYGSLSLVEGRNLVLFEAEDVFGNRASLQRNMQVDSIAPVLSEIQPAVDSEIPNATTPVLGKVTDQTRVTVSVKELHVTTALCEPPVTCPFLIPNVPIQEGVNLLELEAVDEAGNKSTYALRLTGKDRTSPAPPVFFPVISPTRLNWQNLIGKAEPGATVTIRCGTNVLRLQAGTPSGLFIGQIALQAGANTVLATAGDPTGNVSTETNLTIVSNSGQTPPPVGQAWQINTATGNSQQGVIESELPRPLATIITDIEGTPVAGVPVTFTSFIGDGSFVGGTSQITVNTNSQGYAVARYVNGRVAGIQMIQATFPANTAAPVGFFAKAFAPPSNSSTRFSGTVFDQNMRPLPNVLVRLGGQQTRTDDTGNFLFQNVPAGPQQVLELIGRDQVPFPGRWPNISFDIDVIPGLNNSLRRPLFLPRVNEGVDLPLDANNVVTQDTSYDLPVIGDEPPVRITARVGTRVTFPPDVSNRRLSVTRIPVNRVPMVLENGRYTSLYISVQPQGALFDPPLEITLPNADHLSPNHPVLLMSFDHDAGRYVQVGTGRVSADGKSIANDPGSGIRIGAWHGTPSPAPPPNSTFGGGPAPGGGGCGEDDGSGADCGCGPKPLAAKGVISPKVAAEACYRCTASSPPYPLTCENGGLCYGDRPFTGDSVRGDIICTETPVKPKVKIKRDKRQIFLPLGKSLELEAEGSPTPGTYMWSSEDSGVVRITGNGSKVKLEALAVQSAKEKVTVTVTYLPQDSSEPPPSDEIDVIPVDLPRLDVMLPSTRNRAANQDVPAHVLPVNDTSLTIPSQDGFELIVFIKGSEPAEVQAIVTKPANKPEIIRWKVERNPDDHPSLVPLGVPNLSSDTGKTVTLQLDKQGSYRLICYVDSNDNGQFDDGEQVRVVRFAVVEIEVQAAVSQITSALEFKPKLTLYDYGIQPNGEDPYGPVNMILDTSYPDPKRPSQNILTAMGIEAKVILRGGGSKMTLGTSKESIRLGGVGNLIGCTSTVNYPATPKIPVPGTMMEQPNVGYPVGPDKPVLDAPKEVLVTGGGEQFFRNLKSDLDEEEISNPGSLGKMRTVKAADAPNLIWDFEHQTTRNPWETTAKGLTFREYLVASLFSNFPRNLLVLSEDKWEIRYDGQREVTKGPVLKMIRTDGKQTIYREGGWVSTGAKVLLNDKDAQSDLLHLLNNGKGLPGNQTNIQLWGKVVLKNIDSVYLPKK